MSQAVEVLQKWKKMDERSNHPGDAGLPLIEICDQYIVCSTPICND